MDYIDRETGAFPVSIGTSLALEGLLQRHPNQPKMPPGHKRISQVWINVHTLVRNFFASMTAKQQEAVTIDGAAALLLEEMTTITTVMEQEGKGRFTVLFYVSSPDEVRWQFPNAQYKAARTAKQKFRQNLEDYTYAELELMTEAQDITIHRIGKQPQTVAAVVVLLTHLPHELFWRFQFDGLFLLESHTGKLKSYNQWHSKLKGVSDDDDIPFNRFTLQVFGDGALFDAEPKAIRDELKQLAETRHWTKITTLEKIYSDLDRYGGERLKATYGRLMSR